MTRLVIPTALMLGCVFACVAGVPAAPAAPPAPSPTASDSIPRNRYVVFVSDLHFGPIAPTGVSPLDDFRWPRSLTQFLNHLNEWGHQGVDLVVLGDLLEMWQHPSTSCSAPSTKDLGCTEAELAAVLDDVIRAHAVDLRALWTFAESGTNRLFIVPGNHDAALQVDSIWARLQRAVDRPAARVTRQDSGIWSSSDGAIAAEHGHQIGSDVSGFRAWPQVLRLDGAVKRIEKPWGEAFVERFFDGVEGTFEVIDNIIPQSDGIGLYANGKNLATLGDIGRLLLFNVSGVGPHQFGQLGAVGPQGQPVPWNIGAARQRGYMLVADALPNDNWYRAGLLSSRDTNWVAARKDLDAAVRETSLPDEQIAMLCDQVSQYATAEAGGGARKDTLNACNTNLMASLVGSLIPERRVLANHLKARLKSFPLASIFVYGHTHTPQEEFNVSVGGHSIGVLNTGGFQRLVDRPRLERIAGASRAPLSVKLGELPACYSFVRARKDGPYWSRETVNWVKAEDDGPGTVVDLCAPQCAKLARACFDPNRRSGFPAIKDLPAE